MASLTEQSPRSFGRTNTQAYGRSEVQSEIGDQLDVNRAMLKWVCRGAPPTTSPDRTPAHNTLNYSVVLARYRRAFCVMLALRP